MRPPHPQLLEFLAAYPAQAADLFLAVREFVLQEAPEASEVVFDGYSAVSITFTFTESWTAGFCHVVAYSKHVNLGFNRGSQLPDPHGVLIGDGNWVRHISIHTAGDLSLPYLRDYIQAAIEEIGPPDKKSRPKVILKATPGSKRRPKLEPTAVNQRSRSRSKRPAP